MNRRALAVLAAACALAGSCAQVGSPGGGLVDETPPFVVGTAPDDSAVGVPRDAAVVVRFSERMNRESVERALFIAPYPDPFPRTEWRDGDRTLRIDFVRPLGEDRTYVITVGTEARDGHNVRLAAAHTIAFATGDRLDSGELRGLLWREARGALGPAEGATVGLYPLDRETPPDPATDYPAYETQTGEDGSFAFRYLSPGRYRVFGWDDRNSDERLGEDEAIAVPTRDATLAADERGTLPRMRLVAVDRVPPELLIVRSIDCTHVEIRFAEAVVADSVRIAVAPPETLATTVIPALRPEASIRVRTAPQFAGRSYRVAIRAVDPAGNAASWAPDTTSFDGTSLPDTSAPRAKSWSVAEPIVVPRVPVTILFDDVLGDFPLDSLRVLSGETVVPGTWEFLRPALLRFVPAADLPPRVATWRMPLGPVRDASGNRGADTLGITLARVPADSLGELAGTIVDSAGGDRGALYVEARPLGRDWRVSTVVREPGPWRMDTLPAGSYRLFAWRDEDGDAAWSAGRISPFRPAERWTLSDTVHVRARWTVSGVRLAIE